MHKDKSYKKADYDNSKPRWQKTKSVQVAYIEKQSRLINWGYRLFKYAPFSANIKILCSNGGNVYHYDFVKTPYEYEIWRKEL